MQQRNGTDLMEREEGSVAGDVLSRGGALMQVRTQYATAVAVQKPRKLAEVERRFMDEAALAGEEFYYGWRAGKDTIEGPSVKLAMSVARCWGNCAIDAMPVQELPDSWIFTAAFIDLETGFTLTRQFRQSKKWTVFGKLDDERKDDVRFQIGQSKAARNCILNALPSFLVSKGMAKAREGVRVKIEAFVKEKGIAAAVDMVLRALAKQGAKEPIVLAKLGIADRKAIDVEALVILRGDLSALENGQERVETLYPDADNPTNKVDEKLAGQKPAPQQQASKTEPVREEEPPTTQDPPSGKQFPDDVPPEKDAGSLADLISDLSDKIDSATTEPQFQDISAELVRRKGELGEAYQEISVLLTAKSQKVRASGKAGKR